MLSQVPLTNFPTLIIDDEGDQAGLNNKVKDAEESTTYTRILSLKNVIPHHSYLQYTATPQAPLLINIVDVLSPSFAEVLTPGGDYTRRKRIFYSAIPSNYGYSSQRNSKSDQSSYSSPPIFIACVANIFLGSYGSPSSNNPDPNRSMMVHPSQRILPHGQFSNWVQRAREGWLQILNEPDGTPEKDELIQQFYQDYLNLQGTEPTIQPFENLRPRLIHALRRTAGTRGKRS